MTLKADYFCHLVLRQDVLEFGQVPRIPEGTRTLNLRIDSTSVANDNPCESNDLEHISKTPCRPAYRDSSDTVSLNGTALPNELSELILCWSDLPEHIKQAIHTLARGSK